MWGVWIFIVAGMIWFAVRERRSKGTYWWEFNFNPLAWAIGLPLTTVAIVFARYSESWGPFIWGVLAAICLPALVTGLVYRLELHRKGVKPKYRLGGSSGTPHDPGDDL